LQHRLEYIAIRSVVSLLKLIPFRSASDFGGMLGRLGYRVGIRARVVEAQIRFAFPEFSDADVQRIARESYDNLGRTSIEAAMMEKCERKAMVDLFEAIDGWEHIDAALAQGRGALLVTGHLGNWEVGGACIAAKGTQVDAIARHMSNRLFERYLTEVREQNGLRIVFDEQAVRQMPRSLRENRIVGSLVDQGVAGLASSFVPFFGRLAKTPRGPAVFMQRLKVPMVFAVAVRQASRKYRLIIEPIASTDTGDREADITAIVADFTARLEHWVRQYPGQYFWQHRRWKYQPEGAPPLPDGM
jgi:Kdo2-lipid IVA lauroyltransferase/acyltransferase